MRAWLLASLLLGALMAGCSDSADESSNNLNDTFADIDVDVSETTGAILGVVVDESIRPVVDALVELKLPDSAKEARTDKEGRFSFSKVPAGSYFLEISKLAYKSAQVTVDVEAGKKNPPFTKVMLERLFSKDPFTEVEKFTGFLVCGYSLGVSSTCANDYTRIISQCNGGCAPQLAGIAGDRREYITDIGGGWQTMLFEMTWEPSAAGTSNAMQVVVSFAERPGASHWYANYGSEKPLRLQLDVGEPHPTRSGDPDRISEDGQDDIFVFMNVASGGVSLNQEFEVIQTEFYYAPAPEGWSFIAGDPLPF